MNETLIYRDFSTWWKDWTANRKGPFTPEDAALAAWQAGRFHLAQGTTSSEMDVL